MVRSDKSLEGGVQNSQEWLTDELSGKKDKDVERYRLPKGTKGRMSFSGSERNSVFAKSEDGNFVNVSGVSGLDLISDGRCVAMTDFNNDGLNDFLLTNANQPTLGIHENRIGSLKANNEFVAIKVVGGNSTSQPSTEFTSRDGIGALIRVQSDSLSQIREVRCGDGLATQNSRVNIVGLGGDQTADIEVRWPSGKVSRVEDVASGKLIVVFENTEQPEAEGREFHVSEYRRQEHTNSNAKSDVQVPTKARFDHGIEDNDKLIVITGMATWCANCQNSIPEMEILNDQLGSSFYFAGISIDDQDTPEKLNAYINKHNPPWQLLKPKTTKGKELTKLVIEQLGSAATPFTVVVTPENDVVHVYSGLPTVSDLHKLIQQNGKKAER